MYKSLPCLIYNHLTILPHYATWVLLESALTTPASRRACWCSPLQPVCVSLTRVRLGKRLQEGNVIFIGPTRLFWAFAFTLFYGDLCVCTGFTRSLERSLFCQPASGGFYFFAVVVVSAKITARFQGSVVRRKSRCCRLTMLSENCPGNVGLPLGQRTVVRLFYRRVPRQQRPR